MIIEGWPQIRVFFYKYYFNAVGTKVSGHYREGGHSSGVAIKRGSTVYLLLRVKSMLERVEA